MIRWANVGVGLLLGQRRRQWANSKTTLAQRLIFAGIGIQMNRKELNKTFDDINLK